MITLKSLLNEAEDDRYVSIGFGRFKEKGKEDDENAPTFEKDGDKFVPISQHKAAAKGGDSSAGEDKPKVNIFKKDKEEPKKDGGEDISTPNSVAGTGQADPEVNKAVRKAAAKAGISPKKLGKEEYEKKMAQAAYEALTDANFHTEARWLIADLEGKPELREKPDYPSFDDKDYDEKIKVIRDKYASQYADDVDDDSYELGMKAANEAGWAGATAIESLVFDLKMNGSHKLANTILKSFKDANSSRNETKLKLGKLLPEQYTINEGTRSQVGVIGRNGKIVSAYVHYDGYPSNMKPGLKHHMKNEKDVLKLIKMGGARGIFDDKEIEYYKNGNPLKGDSKDIEGYIKDADRQNGAEFVYLYNIKDKKWYYADTYKDTKLKKLF